VRNALIGFALGLVLCGAVFWGVYLRTAGDAKDRLDRQIEASQVLVGRIAEELGREQRSHKLTRDALESALLEVARSREELGRLREIKSRDSDLIESSADGIDWIIEVLQGLPLLE